MPVVSASRLCGDVGVVESEGEECPVWWAIARGWLESRTPLRA
jgi:hypothetical protein